MNKTTRSLVGALCVMVATPASGQTAPCEGPAFDMTKQLLGEWEEFAIAENGAESLMGVLTVNREAGGCAVSQHFETADGSFSFKSLGTADAARVKWVEHFVFSNGAVATYEWTRDGRDIVMRRTSPSNAEQMKKLVITDLKTDSFLVVEYLSENGGKDWRKGNLTPTRRKMPD